MAGVEYRFSDFYTAFHASQTLAKCHEAVVSRCSAGTDGRLCCERRLPVNLAFDFADQVAVGPAIDRLLVPYHALDLHKPATSASSIADDVDCTLRKALRET